MQAQKMMGFTSPGDQRVPISVRDWNALRLACWRSKAAWEITVRAASLIVDRCKHVSGCPAEQVESVPCLPDCPDREMRMDALVILGAARMFAPIDARKAAADPYMAPSREYFSEMIAELASAQAEIGVLRATLQANGIQVPAPPEREEPAEFEAAEQSDIAEQIEAVKLELEDRESDDEEEEEITQ